MLLTHLDQGTAPVRLRVYGVIDLDSPQTHANAQMAQFDVNI